MDGVGVWLQAPITESFLLMRGAAIALAVLVLLLLVLLVLLRRRRQRRRAQASDKRQEPITSRPQITDVLPVEAANLQGIGLREEQQDAFGLSSLAAFREQGLLAVLCDGMGGMTEGRDISQSVVGEILSRFPIGNTRALSDWPETLAAVNRSVYSRYGGKGGTTLAMAYLLANQLWCWSIGDSDVFLMRDNRLYAINQKHEYLNDLFLEALYDSLPLSQALEDPQRGALSRYIGNAEFGCDFTIAPLTLKAGDALLLCSDGVSDTLSLHEIQEALRLPPEMCCAQLEQGILAVAKPNQDNYTAIVIGFNFTNGKGVQNE